MSAGYPARRAGKSVGTWLTRRCSRPAAAHAHQLATQRPAAGLLNGRVVSKTRPKSMGAASSHVGQFACRSLVAWRVGRFSVRGVPRLRGASEPRCQGAVVHSAPRPAAGRALPRVCLESVPRGQASAPARVAWRPRASLSGCVGT